MNDSDNKTCGKPRVIHFVTGGGSGATQMVLDLAIAQHTGGAVEPLVLLRRKRNPLPEKMRAQIENARLPLVWIENRWPKWRTVSQIAEVCAKISPDIFFAHGYSEHLWGRFAAKKAKVPVIAHVEHNLEKYSPIRLWQARRLARHTQVTVCVSGSVAGRLRERRLASDNLQVIPNGTDVSRFLEPKIPLEKRPPDIVMAARFSRQKDHATLIRAARLLADTGWRGRLFLAGGGKRARRNFCEKLARRLGISEQIHFAGFVEDMPPLLHDCRVSVLSTHYEGLPLSLAESMAAGCLVIGSDAAGVRDIVRDGENGWLFPKGDALYLAGLLQKAVENPVSAQPLADKGTQAALETFSLRRMTEQYNTLCFSLINEKYFHENDTKNTSCFCHKSRDF